MYLYNVYMKIIYTQPRVKTQKECEIELNVGEVTPNTTSWSRSLAVATDFSRSKQN